LRKLVLDEALGLTVCFGRVRLGSDVSNAKLSAGLTEGSREIARAVVGHASLDLHAEACVVSRRLEEGDGAGFRSSFMTWLKAMREASSMQTWTNSQLMPTWRLTTPVRRPLSDGPPAVLLDVDVDELAWVHALVTARRLGRLSPLQKELGPCRRVRRNADFGGDCLPVWRWRCEASTAVHVVGGVRLVNEWGLEERSRPALCSLSGIGRAAVAVSFDGGPQHTAGAVI
jgi:hypothetical protein